MNLSQLHPRPIFTIHPHKMNLNTVLAPFPCIFHIQLLALNFFCLVYVCIHRSLLDLTVITILDDL